MRGTVNFNLPHVGVPAVLVIADDRYLNHECPDRTVVDILDGNDHPAARLVQVHHLHLLKIVEIGPGSDTYPKGLFFPAHLNTTTIKRLGGRYFYLLGV